MSDTARQRVARTALKTLALGALFLFAVGTRSAPNAAIYTAGTFRPAGSDSHLHAWRMVQALRALPALPDAREPLLNHPEGLQLGWPPAFDYLGAVAARSIGADEAHVPEIGSWLVALLGALTPLLAVGVARRFVGFPWALLAGIALAVWPMHLEYTRLGRIDHHVLEPLVVLLALLLYLSAVGAASRRRRLAAAVGFGACLGAAIWGWPTGLATVVLLGAGAILHRLLAPARPALGPVAIVVGLALAAPLCVWYSAHDRWALHAPSLLHCAVFVGLLLAAAWVELFQRRVAPRIRTARARAAAAAGGLIASAALPLLIVPAEEAVALALEFGGRGWLWGMIIEQRPLFSLGLGEITLLMTFALPAFPVLALAAALRPRDGQRDVVLLLIGWAAVALAAGVMQIRALPLAVALMAPICAIGTREAARRIGAWTRGRARPGLARWVQPAIGVAFLPLLWPAADYLHITSQRGPGNKLMFECAARWLRENPPEPTTGVMTPLGAGNVVAHLARAPVVGGMIIDPESARSLRDVLGFYMTTDPARGRAIASRRRISRVVASPMTSGRYERYVRRIGRPPSKVDVAPGTVYRRIMATRLTHDLGSGAAIGDEWLPSIGWLQHAYETPPAPETTAVHVYRAVPGALLEGQAAPGAPVALTLRLLTNQGRPFSFLARTRADAGGRFRLRLPYGSAHTTPPEIARYLAVLQAVEEAFARGVRYSGPRVRFRRPSYTPLGPAVVSSGELAADVVVPPAAVTSGARVAVPPLRARSAGRPLPADRE